jgi:hypothetical protein
MAEAFSGVFLFFPCGLTFSTPSCHMKNAARPSFSLAFSLFTLEYAYGWMHPKVIVYSIF